MPIFSESWCRCASGLAQDDSNARYFSRPSESHCCWASARCSLWSVDCCSRDDCWTDGAGGTCQQMAATSLRCASHYN